jgi:hypothetical protein
MAMHAFTNAGKRMLGMLGCGMALLFFGDLFVQVVLWFSTLLGNRNGMSFWIFMGFFTGAVVVYFDRRFFGPIEEAANKVLAFFEPKE